jgi:hypothetical protein
MLDPYLSLYLFVLDLSLGRAGLVVGTDGKFFSRCDTACNTLRRATFRNHSVLHDLHASQRRTRASTGRACAAMLATVTR